MCFVFGRLDQPTPRSLDADRGEHACTESSGVYSDAIRSNVDVVRDRVPVDHHEAVIGRIVQERIALRAATGN